MNSIYYPPCVVFGFNRPFFLKKILSKLKYQGVRKIIIFIDGARNTAEQQLVDTCRTIAESIDWAEKECHFQDKNQGVYSIIYNVDKVFESYDTAIFLEDDCLPMPSFYYFMRHSLMRYQKVENVFSIGGYQPIDKTFFNDYVYSLVVSSRFLGWGWGTWREKWQEIRKNTNKFRELFNNLNEIPDMAGKDLPEMVNDLKLIKSNSFDWDIKIAVTMLWMKKFQLLPTMCLVKNLGIGTGTHELSSLWQKLYRKYYQARNLNRNKNIDIKWIEDIQPNDNFANEFQKFIKNINQPLKDRLFRFKTL